MQYMLLIMEPRGQRLERSEEEGRQLYERMLRFSDALRSRGVLLGSESLQSDAKAVRVRVRDGKTTLIDGPFAEAKEMVGGYYPARLRKQGSGGRDRARMPGRRVGDGGSARVRAVFHLSGRTSRA